MNNKYSVLFGAVLALLVYGSAEADTSAVERAVRFGPEDIRGIAYLPGPAGPDKSIDPQLGGYRSFFPVTFAIANGIAGGASLDVFKKIMDNPQLGEDFWKNRVIYAANSFNSGTFMKTWLDVTLPH